MLENELTLWSYVPVFIFFTVYVLIIVAAGIRWWAWGKADKIRRGRGG